MADSRGQHVSVPEFRDNEEDSAGFGVSRPPRKTDQSDRECIYDGRLSTPKVEFMLDTIAKCDPSNTNDKGGFGKVYFYKDKHPKLGIPVAIKEVIIEETSQKLKKMSTINERLASRTLHYAIVPLLAMTEDKSKRAFYFLSPYLENGDLFQTLKDDTEKINAGRINDVTLPKQRRLKILYHIGSALDFLHTPVKDIRGPIIHMDVKSLNIVLDADFNARLIDFGLAREMHEKESGIPVTKTEIGGTEGYFPTRGYSVLTKYEDYHNFGVVGLECLTGLPPHNPNDRDGDLRVQHVEKLRDKIQDIWLADDDIGPDAESVLQMFIKCIASPTKKNISSAEICRNLQVLLQHQRISSWDRQHKFENKCEICMINPAGHFWAALLIIGNDVKNSEVARVFKNDIMEVHRLIVSMCPRIIGIRPENVFVVEAETPGLKANLKGKLESVVEKLSKIKSIQTILVYYSGHSDENGFDLENDEVYITGDEFSTHMKRIVTPENAATDSMEFRNAMSRAVSPKRFICFLDCCDPPNLTVLQDRHVCVIQVNACRSKRKSMLETSGSVFTKFFIQALTKSAYGKECIDMQCKCTSIKGDFITVGQLVAYIRSHMKRYQARRNIETYNAPEKHEICVTDHDEKIAFNIDFLEQLEFRFKDPDISSDMMRKKIKPNFISDMQGLSRILFATFIEQKCPALSFDETDLDVYQDCICVEIDKGPKETEELDTIEKVMKAWNSRRDLVVSLRCVSNIRRGMVLLNLHPVKIQQFLEKKTGITSLEICSVPSNSSFTIPFAAIPELKRKIGRKPEGELKCFRDHLSDIMNACRLEENEDALLSIILSNIDNRSEDRRKLPFVCYKVTITEELQQEAPIEGEQSINTESGGQNETIPKQVYNTLTTHQRHERYETGTNIETNTSFWNQTPTDQTGAQTICGKERRQGQERFLRIETAGRDKTVPKNVDNTSTTFIKMSQHNEVEKHVQSVIQIPPLGIERGGATCETRAEDRYVPSERNIQIGLPEYRMDRKPRGYCVIVNNKNFSVERGNSEGRQMPNRNGTDVDAEYLRYTFNRLHFIVRQQDDLSDSGMMCFLLSISQDADNERYDCFVCAILTHGVLNHLYGANGNLVSIRDLTATFQSSRCKALSGKPKIFFIQACQGRDKMTGAECKDDNEDIETDSVVSDMIDAEENSVRSTDIECDAGGISKVCTDSGAREMIPDEADFLIGYATVAGYVSFRSRNHGSWYIRKLCDVLSSHADRTDLLSILTEVNRQVSEANAAMDGGLFKQVPAPYSTLRKLVFFRTIDEPRFGMQKHFAPLQGHQKQLKKCHDQTQERTYQLTFPIQETLDQTQRTEEPMFGQKRGLQNYIQQQDLRQSKPEEDDSITIYKRTEVPNSENEEAKASTIPDKD